MINIISDISYKRITRGLVPGVLFFAVLMATGCKNDPKEINALTGKGIPQEDKAYDVTIIFSEYGKSRARLFSKEFVRNEVAKPPFVDMKKGLKVELFDTTLNVETTLTARYARYYETRGTILIRDSIVVVNRKGERLQTEELVWNQNVQKFYTEKFVKIITPTQVMYGDGLEANEDFSWYTIKNPKGIVEVDKGTMPE